MKTLYDLLSVPRDADDEALNKAYRKAAKACHPDLNAGDPNAPRRFKQITTAIEILRDAEERAAYNRLLDRERRRVRLRQTHIVIANTITAAVLIVVLAGYGPIQPVFSTATVLSEAEDNAVQRLVATAGEQGTPRAEPAGGGIERGGLEQGLTATAVSEQLAADDREAGLSHEPQGRQNEAAARSEQDERPQVVERERPQAEHEAAPRPEQTCKRGSLACGGNRPAAVTLREEPKARPSAEIGAAPRSAALARRVAPAPSQATPNLLQRVGASISGIFQHCPFSS